MVVAYIETVTSEYCSKSPSDLCLKVLCVAKVYLNTMSSVELGTLVTPKAHIYSMVVMPGPSRVNVDTPSISTFFPGLFKFSFKKI